MHEISLAVVSKIDFFNLNFLGSDFNEGRMSSSRKGRIENYEASRGKFAKKVIS